MTLCFLASASVSIAHIPGPKTPSSDGEIPPVIIKPTPPAARRAKKAACLSGGNSSRPVCIEPIITRLGRVTKLKSNGCNT